MRSGVIIGKVSQISRYWMRSVVGLLFSAVLVVLVVSGGGAGGVSGSQNRPVLTAIVSTSYKSVPVAPGMTIVINGLLLSDNTLEGFDQQPAIPGIQYPEILGGVRVSINGRPAGLRYVSPVQLNCVVPQGLQDGTASVVVTTSGGSLLTGTIEVARVAPLIPIYPLSEPESPYGFVERRRGGVTQSITPLSEISLQQLGRYVPKPIDMGVAGDQVVLRLMAGGIRLADDTDRNNNVNESVRVVVGGVEYTPIFAGRDSEDFDRVDVELPRALAGSGRLSVAISAIGYGSSNVVVIDVGGERGSAPPVVTGLGTGPRVAGEELTISGRGFSSTPEGNTVRIGNSNKDVEVVSATATELKVRVPYGVQAGAVTVRTALGEGRSSSNLSIVTSVSGYMRDTDNQPLPGIEVSATSPATRQIVSVVTRNDGSFVLPLPGASSNTKLTILFRPGIDGTFPFSSFPRSQLVRPFQDNHMNSIPVQQDTGPALFISNERSAMPATAVQIPIQPTRTLLTGGVVLEVPTSTRAVFPDGATSGNIRLTIVEKSRTPVSLPEGRFSSSVVQITPFGTRLMPGARLTFPNRDGYKPSEKVELLRFDQNPESPNLGTFVVAGLATVSEDGREIETDENVITEATIYLVSNKRPTTTIVGRVVESDNQTPVRGALVRSRTQEALSDGNGGFIIPGVPAGSSDLLVVDASLVRPSGRVDQTERGEIKPVVGGFTEVRPALALPSRLSNRQPVVLLSGGLVVSEGQTREISFTAFDPDPGQTIQLRLIGPPFVSLSESTRGVYVIRARTSLGDAGRYPLSIVATDSLGLSATFMRTLVVNRGPVATAQTLTVQRNTALSLTLTGSDPDRDPLSFEIVSTPVRGRLVGDLPRLTYTPNANYVGPDSFTFRVSDGQSSSGLATISINVTSSADQKLTLDVPGPQSATVGQPLSFQVSAVNPNPDRVLTFSMTGNPQGSTLNKVATDRALFSWTPTTAQTTSLSITFTVKDNGTPQLVDNKPVVFTVSGSNTSPVKNEPPSLIVPAEKSGVSGQPIEFTISATDPNAGQALSFTMSGQPQGAVLREINSGSSLFSWTPEATQTNSWTITFTVRDNGTPQLSSTGTTVITVVPANRQPVLTVQSAWSVSFGQLLSFEMTASDPDPGQSLTFSMTDNPPESRLFPNSNRATFRWGGVDGGANLIGTWSVKFTVRDNGSPQLSDTKTVVITVTAPNQQPVLTVPGNQRILYGTQLAFPISAIDPNPGQTLTLNPGNLPSGASVTQNGSNNWRFVWTPTFQQRGSYSVTFTVRDNGSPQLSDTKTVNIFVDSGLNLRPKEQ